MKIVTNIWTHILHRMKYEILSNNMFEKLNIIQFINLFNEIRFRDSKSYNTQYLNNTVDKAQSNEPSNGEVNLSVWSHASDPHHPYKERPDLTPFPEPNTRSGSSHASSFRGVGLLGPGSPLNPLNYISFFFSKYYMIWNYMHNYFIILHYKLYSAFTSHRKAVQ